MSYVVFFWNARVYLWCFCHRAGVVPDSELVAAWNHRWTHVQAGGAIDGSCGLIPWLLQEAWVESGEQEQVPCFPPHCET